MSFKKAHKNKVKAKMFGRKLTRYTLHVVGEPLLKKPLGSGKNQIHTVVIGTAAKSGSGESILAKLAALDAKDGGTRVEQLLSES
ncbi:TPA: hypothetical protein ACGVAY_004243 [Vibrio vulnificus]